MVAARVVLVALAFLALSFVVIVRTIDVAGHDGTKIRCLQQARTGDDIRRCL